MNKQDEILIASYYALVWWCESLTKKYFESKEFESLDFNDQFVKTRLAEGQAPLALIMPSLYVALVLPKETLFKKYKDEFDEIDFYLQKYVKQNNSSYCRSQKIKISPTRHIRNAVAHADTEFTATTIIFRDQRIKNKNENFYVEIPFDKLGCFVNKLQHIILKRIVEIQKMQNDPSISRRP